MPKEECFVIMPFSKSERHSEEYWNGHYEQFLKPLIEETGIFEAHRSEPLRGDILNKIIKDLVKAKVVVADITDSNPNVFWELGVRQSFKNGTVTIVESDLPIPFDLSKKGILKYYPHDHIAMALFRKKFGQAIEDIINNPNESDSQVLDSISGRSSLYGIFQKEEILRRLDALIEEMNFNILFAISIKESLKQKKGIGNVSFQSCSLQLLVTHRYLDEKTEFYNVARWILLRIDFSNSTYQGFGEDIDAMIKHYTPSDGTAWENAYDKGLTERFQQFLSEIVKIRKRIETDQI